MDDLRQHRHRRQRDVASDSEAIAIAIRLVNDAPDFTMPSGTKFITDGSF